VRAVAFTVDVDRDVNLACQGDVCSISKGGGAPRFGSSARGLELVLQVLEEMGVKGTFFWEGRTAEVLSARMDLAGMMRGHEVALHGYDHEDFSGKESGLPLDRQGTKEALDRGEGALERVFGRGPRGFRAPYQRTTEALLDELRERGYLYDSSETAPLVDGAVGPYLLGNGLPEAPVCWARDRRGRRIVSYLWPYHEGKRSMGDYLDLIEGFQEGLLVIATHSWHLVESYCAGLRPEEEVRQGTDALRTLLEGAERAGAELVTIAAHLRRAHAL